VSAANDFAGGTSASRTDSSRGEPATTEGAGKTQPTYTGWIGYFPVAMLHRKPVFDCGAKLDLLRDTTFELAKNYTLILQA
jgi:hypothetical protein